MSAGGHGEVDAPASEVIHRISLSAWPNATGTGVRRRYALTGNRLVLTTPPTLLHDRALVLELLWLRVA